MKNELKEEEPQNINITTSAADTQRSQEKEGSLEELRLVDKELSELEEPKKRWNYINFFR